MKKVLNFLVNTEKGENFLLVISVAVIVSLVIGAFLCLPVFWMGGIEYQNSWMNSVGPYFFFPFIGCVAFFLFLFMPYMWYVSHSEKFKGEASTKKLMSGMAIVCSIIPGAFFYSFIFKALFIPYGIHNLLGMLVCGMVYLLLVKTILKKPFSIAQEFVPLS